MAGEDAHLEAAYEERYAIDREDELIEEYDDGDEEYPEEEVRFW